MNKPTQRLLCDISDDITAYPVARKKWCSGICSLRSLSVRGFLRLQIAAGKKCRAVICDVQTERC